MRSIYGVLLVGSIGLAVMVCQFPRAAEGLLRLVRVQLGTSGSQAQASQAPTPVGPSGTGWPASPPRPTGADVGVAYVESDPVTPSGHVARGSGNPFAESSVGGYPPGAYPSGGYRYPSTDSRRSLGQAAPPISPWSNQQGVPRDPRIGATTPLREFPRQEGSGAIVSRPTAPGQGFSTQDRLSPQAGFPAPREAVPSPGLGGLARPAPQADTAMRPGLYQPSPLARGSRPSEVRVSPYRDSADPLDQRRSAATLSGASAANERSPAPRQSSRWDPPTNPAVSSQAGPAVQRGPVPCEGGQQLARVGDNVILACEILPAFNEMLVRQEEKLAQMSPQQREQEKQLLMQALLRQRVATMLVYADFQRSVPAEGIAEFEKRIGEQFDTEELPRKLQQSGLASRQALDAELRKFGSSLERQRENYLRQFVRQWWPRQQLDGDVEITHDQMLAYYREHLADYAHPARSRWEQLTVLFQNHPSKEKAWRQLTWMGNQVAGGAPFAEIAQQHSEGPAAAKGGAWDWTGRGALRSEAIDQAIFSQPVGRLGLRLEDERGFHIVRVIEREDAHHTPFEEMQAIIREALLQEHKESKLAEYSERLQEEIEVWTIFDEDATASRGRDPASRLH